MPVCVVLTKEGMQEVAVDNTPRSPFVKDTLGGEPTIVGSWEDSAIVLLGLQRPKKRDIVPASLLPPHGRDNNTTLYFPLMCTRLNVEYAPVDFTIEDYHALLCR